MRRLALAQRALLILLQALLRGFQSFPPRLKIIENHQSFQRKQWIAGGFFILA